MLAEFAVLAHETNSLSRPASVEVVVTGLASPGKTRLLDALQLRLPAHVEVHAASETTPLSHGRPVLRVHASSDLEALIEGAGSSAFRRAAHDADLVVAVDWERTERSLERVIGALAARGLACDLTGA